MPERRRIPRAATFGAIFLIALFTMVLSAVTTGRTAGIDERSVSHLHDLTGGSAPFFETVSVAGGPLVRTMVVGTVALGLLVSRRRWSAAFAVVAVGGAGLVDTLVKLTIARPRPHLPTPVVAADGYAFPSGHAAGSLALVIAGSALLWHLTSRPVLTAAAASVGAAFALLVGVSRVALGVHYPTDVLGAYALAGAWVAAVLVLFGPRLAWEGGRPPGGRAPLG